MLSPYSRAPARPPCAVDGWTGEGWRLLERHALAVRAAPADALAALLALRLRDVPLVRALFWLRRLRSSPDAPLRSFFSTPPFAVLTEEPGREVVFGVLLPGTDAADRDPAPAADGFREALRTAPFAAIGTFNADARRDGTLLWTETWGRTRGARARLLFGAYWLAVGPFSAWTRRIFLRAAKEHAEAEAGR